LGIFDKLNKSKVKDALKRLTPKVGKPYQLKSLDIMAGRLLDKWSIIQKEGIPLSMLFDDAETPYLCQITTVERVKGLFGGEGSIRIKCQYNPEDAYQYSYYNSFYGDEEYQEDYYYNEGYMPTYNSMTLASKDIIKIYVDPEFYEKLMIILTT